MKKIWLSLLIVAVVVSGCLKTVIDDEKKKDSISQTESGTRQPDTFQTVKMTTSGGTVYYLADQTDRDEEAVIILLHGLTGNHEDMMDTGKFFYNLGYAVVTLDLYGHEGDIYSMDVDISQMIDGSMERLEDILDALEEQKLCDAERFAVFGMSLGGMVSFYMGAYGDRIPQAIITIASLPDIESVFQHALNYLRSTWSAKEARFVYATAQEQENLIRWAAENSPLNEIERLSKIPTLMVNGTEDQFMDIESARKFCSDVENLGGEVILYENEHGKHDEIGNYHAEEIASMLGEFLPD